MQIDAQLIGRLIDLSKTKSYNAYDRFQWPESVSADRLWCDEDLLTTYGTDIHKTLKDEELWELSKWEAINFFSLNVHGIKSVLEFVCRCIYEKKYANISEYLHFFISEENAHMWFFARFCLRYAGKIYPGITFKASEVADSTEADLYMFASCLIFEEFVDFYNHKVGLNEKVVNIVREINYQHHLDESRHVSFGREVVRELFNEIAIVAADDQALPRIGANIKNMIMYFVGLMYNSQVYSDAKIVGRDRFSTPGALRNHLRHSLDRRRYHSIWFKRTADYFMRCGIIDSANFITSN